MVLLLTLPVSLTCTSNISLPQYFVSNSMLFVPWCCFLAQFWNMCCVLIHSYYLHEDIQNIETCILCTAFITVFFHIVIKFSIISCDFTTNLKRETYYSCLHLILFSSLLVVFLNPLLHYPFSLLLKTKYLIRYGYYEYLIISSIFNYLW